ncbi:MAG: ParB/RepB/Spo0J family partition protein [Clostridiaceae bacterium]|nr:ParB/RepB/Spo0J family partition protein [Clostridiaceae bacterium]
MAKTTKKRGLGKGLEALIPQINIVEEEVTGDIVKDIPINKIYPNPHQPRKDFKKEAIESLAQSIKNHGLIQPIIVTEQQDGYMIIAGERRWRASKSIEVKEVSCIVRQHSEQQLIEIALIENIQREDLNVIEEGEAYKYLIDRYKVTQDQLAEAMGKSRPYIANILRLLQLHSDIIDMIKEGRITGGHGRALLSISNPQEQYQIALKVESEKLSVRQVEELVKSLNNSNKKEKTEKKKEFFIIEIEENLKSLFGTKVNITKGRKKGKIEIEYYNEGDLERILSLLEKNH